MPRNGPGGWGGFAAGAIANIASRADAVVHLTTSLADWFTRKRAPVGIATSARDVYLSPHCDDIAFSLGCFAAARGAGRLVTVFTQSNFTLDPTLADLSA